MMGSFISSIQEQSLATLTSLLLLGLFLAKLAQLRKAISSPLSTLPGPWYASLTTLHLNYAFATGTIWKLVEQNHRKYGPTFRLGPRQIWTSDKTTIKEVLQTIDLPKVSMYAEISRDRYSPGLFGEMCGFISHTLVLCLAD